MLIFSSCGSYVCVCARVRIRESERELLHFSEDFLKALMRISSIAKLKYGTREHCDWKIKCF